jgi:hypothetical protein
VAAGFDAIESAFRVQIERAKATGQLNAELDVEAAATFLLMSFEGVLVLARSGAGGLAAGIDATFAALAGPT